MATKNNSMYPWLTDEQVKRLEEAVKNLTWAERDNMSNLIYKWVLEMNNQEKIKKEKTQAANEYYYRWVTSDDEYTRNYGKGCGNLESLLNTVRDALNLDANYSSADVLSWTLAMARDKGISQATFDKCVNENDPTFLYEMWFAEKPEENFALKNNLWTLKNIWIGIGAWLWIASTPMFWNTARNLYWHTIPNTPKDEEIRSIRNTWNKEIGRYEKEIEKREKLIAEKEKIIAEAEKNPKFTDSMKQSIRETYWAEIEQYWNEINSLKQSINNTENRLDKAWETPTTEESAYEYWVRWASRSAIRDKAFEEANVLWNAGVKTKLETSKQTLNLKELLDNVNIKSLAKDNTELKWLEEALESLKAVYKDPEYWNMSMAAANDLKSNLYDKLPVSAYDWKNIASNYKKVVARVSQMIKEETQSKLSQEFWENVTKQYRDWANLHNVYEDYMMWWVWKSDFMEKWLINKVSAWVQAATKPIFSQWWYYASKLNEWLTAWLNKAKEWVKALVSEVKENPVKSVKEWVKWLTREMPATMIMDDIIEKQEYLQDNQQAKVANAFNITPESKRDSLYSKKEVEEMVKSPWFVEAAKEMWLDLDKLAKHYGIGKTLNSTIDTQAKKKAEENKNKLSTKSKIENEIQQSKSTNSTINQLNKTTALKNQKATVWTKKKSGK